MLRHIASLILLLSAIFVSACQLDASRFQSTPAAEQIDTPTPIPTFTPTPTLRAEPQAEAFTSTPTQTPLPTYTSTPTNTPTPTHTPIPSDRLALARRAYASGDYQTARFEFDNLLADSGADLNEKRVALHWRGRSELELGDTTAAIATLKMFLQQYPADESVRAAQFNLGRAYEQSGQLQEAIGAYRGTIIPNDPVNVYIYERIGDISLRTGAYTETVAVYQAGIDSTDDLSFKVHLREGIAKAELLLNDNPEGAIAQYEEILKIAKIGSYRAKILRLLGDTYLKADNIEAAYQQYLEAVNRYPEAHDSYLALVELVNAEVPVDDFQRGLVDYHAAAYQPAIAAFEAYLAQTTPQPEPDPSAIIDTSAEPISSTITVTATHNPPPRPVPAEETPLIRAAEATWFIALSWKALGQYNRAILTYQKLTAGNDPNNQKWGEAHIEIGRTLISQGNRSRAKAVLRDFAAETPDHPLAPEALWRAARLDMGDELFDEAHSHLHLLADTYPDSEYAAGALYWAGQSSHQLQDYEGAAQDWAMLLDKYPDHELAIFAGYWQARALLAIGRDVEAKAILNQLAEGPIDYYVLRARDLSLGTGQQPDSIPLQLPTETQLNTEQTAAETWLQQWLPNEAKTNNPSASSHQFLSDPAFQRGDALIELGLRDEALIEFEIVKDNWWDDPLSMYQLSLYFREKGMGRLSIISAARLIFLSPASAAEDTPIFIQRLYYPIYYEDVIFSEAEKLGVDPALLAAIIRQESLFEPSANSPANARGLMQVIPATGEYVAQRSGFDNFNDDQLWLPYLNIKFGAWYIHQQLQIFENNQFAALAAYNAGPGNVLEWIKTSDDLDIFVESIPFRESRFYIRTVYVNLAAYRRLYGIPPKNQQ